MGWAEGTPQRRRYFQPGSLQASLWGTPWQLPFRIAPRCHQRWRRNGSGWHPQAISWLNVYNCHYINPQPELEFWTNLANHGDHVMQLSGKDGDLRGRSLFQWRFIAGKILKPNKGFSPFAIFASRREIINNISIIWMIISSYGWNDDMHSLEDDHQCGIVESLFFLDYCDLIVLNLIWQVLIDSYSRVIESLVCVFGYGRWWLLGYCPCPLLIKQAQPALLPWHARWDILFKSFLNRTITHFYVRFLARRWPVICWWNSTLFAP